jgi:hypothetical protein
VRHHLHLWIAQSLSQDRAHRPVPRTPRRCGPPYPGKIGSRNLSTQEGIEVSAVSRGPCGRAGSRRTTAQSMQKSSIAENFIRSAKAPVISAV